MGYLYLALLLSADILGLFLAYFFGAQILGNGLFWPQWSAIHAFHEIADILRPSFPKIATLFTDIQPGHLGLLWVAFYLYGRLLQILRAFVSYVKARGKLGKPARGGEIEKPVEDCYEEFDIAATKATYPPLIFKTPKSFRYRPGAVGMEIGWIGLMLAIDSNLLTSWQLAPRLARELAHYNSLDHWLTVLESGTPPLWKSFALFIGLFISLPTFVKTFTGCFYWRKRAHDADHFACLLGQAQPLLRVLDFDCTLQYDRGFFRRLPYVEERKDRIKAFLQQGHPVQKQQVKP